MPLCPGDSEPAWQPSLEVPCDLVIRPFTERRLHQEQPPSKACINTRKEGLRKGNCFLVIEKPVHYLRGKENY